MHIGIQDFGRWLFSPRMIVFAAMMYFIADYAIFPMIENSRKMEGLLQAYEPFLAIGNSLSLSVVIPAIFLVLMGDFPRMDENGELFLFRAGRMNWLAGQLLTAALAAFAFLTAIFGLTLLLSAGHLSFDNEWSRTVTHFYQVFPEEQENYAANFITGELYNNFTPREALGYTFTLLFGYLVLLCLLQLVARLIAPGSSGLVVGGMVIALGCVFNRMHSDLKWLFPGAHAIEWLHCDVVWNRMPVTMTQSYLYFLLLGGLLFLAAVLFADRIYHVRK